MAGRPIDKKRLQAFLKRLSESLNRPGVIFLLGGSSLTWLEVKRDSIDVDLALAEDESDPVPLLEAIAAAGDFIEAVVDVMRPHEMLPLPEGYAERMELAAQFGPLTVYLFDPYSIALTKLARSAAKDTLDVGGMLQAGLIDCATLRHHFDSVLARYQRRVARGDWEDLQRKFDAFYSRHCQ
jgi:hypothetical protein